MSGGKIPKMRRKGKSELNMCTKRLGKRKNGGGEERKKDGFSALASGAL